MTNTGGEGYTILTPAGVSLYVVDVMYWVTKQSVFSHDCQENKCASNAEYSTGTNARHKCQRGKQAMKQWQHVALDDKPVNESTGRGGAELQPATTNYRGDANRTQQYGILRHISQGTCEQVTMPAALHSMQFVVPMAAQYIRHKTQDNPGQLVTSQQATT